MDEKIPACPCCGGQAERLRIAAKWSNSVGHKIRCTRCGLSTPCRVRNADIEIWSRRVPECRNGGTEAGHDVGQPQQPQGEICFDLKKFRQAVIDSGLTDADINSLIENCKPSPSGDVERLEDQVESLEHELAIARGTIGYLAGKTTIHQDCFDAGGCGCQRVRLDAKTA